MSLQTITVTFSETYSVSQFESTKPSVTISGTQKEGESLLDLYARTYKVARYFFLLALCDSLEDHRQAGQEPRPDLESWAMSSLNDMSKDIQLVEEIKGRRSPA